MNETLLLSGQFLVFGAIALVGFIIVAVGVFTGGHDHEVDHGHDAETDGHGEPTVSFFSPKVLAAFALGFGGAGAIATAYGKSGLISCLAGAIIGLAIGAVALIMMRGFYSQQSSSSLVSGDAVGKTAMVSIEIPEHGQGEVSLAVRGTYSTYPARNKGASRLTQGTMVKVVQDLGGQLIVEKQTA